MANLLELHTTNHVWYGVELLDEQDREAAGAFCFPTFYLDAPRTECLVVGCYADKKTAEATLKQIEDKRKELYPQPPRNWRRELVMLAIVTAIVAFGAILGILLSPYSPWR